MKVAALSAVFEVSAMGNTAQAGSLERWVTDSREQGNPADALFFALVGDRHNGHNFLADLYARGYRAFVVSEAIDSAHFPEAVWWQVPDTLCALQNLAGHWRHTFDYPVVGITGSNGKTIVKEWLSLLAGSQYRVVKSPKSYNSQVGVPLSLNAMRSFHSLGVFEAGISRKGEMTHLAQMIKPEYGIFTKLGTAHDEGFAGWQEKLAEKASLFEHTQAVVYRADDDRVAKYFQESVTGPKHLAWSTRGTGSIQATLEGQHLSLSGEGMEATFTLPFTDAVSLENLTHALVLLLHLGMNAQALQAGISLLRSPAMRLSLKDGVHDCLLIDDTYNNDLAGLEIALHFMGQQPPRHGKTVILSDMAETGQAARQLLGAVEERLRAQGVTRWIGVGPSHQAYSPSEDIRYETFATTEDLQAALPSLPFEKELILIKGARTFGFERVVSTLQQKVHGTMLEVNLDALTHNLNLYRSQLKPNTKLMVMVKALAYGSGSEEIAHLLQYHRVDFLAVAYADEGVQLRERGISLPIMVMNPSPDSFAKIMEHNLQPELYSPTRLREFGEYVRSQGQNAAIHLKIDTGMRRLGFEPEEIPALLKTLAAYPELRVESAFSHLVGADSAEHIDFSHRQAANFSQAAEVLETGLGYTVIKHLVNSPGIVRYPEYHFDMVRLGIGLYGIEAAGILPEQLRPVSRLVTTISQIKEIAAGETVGYSRKGVAEGPSRIATLAIGYADGYDRGFSKGVGHVLINGHHAPVIGNVCMDMTMVDITGIPAQEGDQAIIFGPELPLDELAERIGTISYELLTNVSTRVKRVYHTE